MTRSSRSQRDYSAARACLGKQAHGSWAEAEAAVYRIIEENILAGTPKKSSRLGSYRCVYCDRWHVGHSAGPRPWGLPARHPPLRGCPAIAQPAAMDEALRREILVNLRALTAYLERGYDLEWVEPPVRGRKGPDRHPRRHLGITLFRPDAFDSLRWEATKRALGSGPVESQVESTGPTRTDGSRRMAPPRSDT